MKERWRCVILGLFLCVTGCASTHSVDVKYYDISPKVVGAVVFTDSRNATGINQTCIDRYALDAQGNCSPIQHDSASAPGTLPALLTGIVGSSAANTATGAVIGVIK
jgi:hypothetical protein